MYKTGIGLIILGGIINWYAYLKIEDRLKMKDYFIWGTALAFLGLGLTIAQPSK